MQIENTDCQKMRPSEIKFSKNARNPSEISEH